MSDLERLTTSLTNIVDEFANANRNSDALEAAIRAPHGETALRSEVDRFEGAWDDKRETLRQDLEALQERVADFVKAWQDFDSEAAQNLDATENAPQVPQQ